MKNKLHSTQPERIRVHARDLKLINGGFAENAQHMIKLLLEAGVNQADIDAITRKNRSVVVCAGELRRELHSRGIVPLSSGPVGPIRGAAAPAPEQSTGAEASPELEAAVTRLSGKIDALTTLAEPDGGKSLKIAAIRREIDSLHGQMGSTVARRRTVLVRQLRALESE